MMMLRGGRADQGRGAKKGERATPRATPRTGTGRKARVAQTMQWRPGGECVCRVRSKGGRIGEAQPWRRRGRPRSSGEMARLPGRFWGQACL